MGWNVSISDPLPFAEVRLQNRKTLRLPKAPNPSKRLSTKSQINSQGQIQQVQPSVSADASRDLSADDDLHVTVRALPPNTREISASIRMATPLTSVWNVLTDYSHLSDFLPSLAENKLLERRPNGAKLLQVGQQKLPFGLRFTARAVVEVVEGPFQMVAAMAKGGQRNGRGHPKRSLEFSMVEGDFKVFKGTWAMEEELDTEAPAGQSVSTLVTYSVVVTPQGWLPVAVIESFISNEIKSNLRNVRNEVVLRHVASVALRGN
eukprot:TRINITY_DN1543_c0_g1_i1.p1 TRINITY_DN1543_c0_g1~~TRINITY_DN1543_c0_g1_i1.p1  ORF type:complete len:303 (-),score=45.73 TRINITY_DN1543_c0_g1_i1:143-931(-)